MFGSLPLVNGVNVSHTQSSFCVCNDRGFACYSSDPIKFKFGRDFGKGIQFADQWHDSNIVVLVGGGKEPMFPPNTLIVWNDERQNIVCQNEFDSDIKNLMVTHSRLVVALDSRIYYFKFPPILDRNNFVLKEVDHYDTLPNPKGNSVGVLKVFIEEKSSLKDVELDLKCTLPFDRFSLFEHPKDKSLIIAISVGGGCYIDVWDVVKKSFLIKYSRSLNPAVDINFSWEPHGNYLCVSTEKKILRYYDLSLCRKPDENQQGYIMRSNFARFQIELDKKGAYQTRCWFTRGSSRLIVTRIEEDRESLSYDLYNEVVPSNHEGNSGPLSLLSLVVCDSDTSFQVI